MLGDAIREIRFHPGRFVATLVAIAISVGFLAAVSIFMTSQVTALGKIVTLPASAADVVVAPIPYNAAGGDVEPLKDPAEFTIDQIKKVPGVALVEQVQSNYTIGAVGDKTDYLSLYGVPSPAFQWTQPIEGRWPTKEGEIALSSDGMKKLGVKLGDKIEVGTGDTKATIVGVTREPTVLFGSAGYEPRAKKPETSTSEPYLIKLAPGADPAAVVAALAPLVKPYGLQANTLADYQTVQINSLTNDINVTKYILQVFGVIALLVGIITIANTFNILVVQRRRQIGLLRAVGASGPQVRRRQLLEAVVLGVIGSVLGLALATAIAAIGMWATKSLWAGLRFPVGELALWAGVGVLATVIAAVLPAIRATRVTPLEALQPVPTSEAARRASWVRLAISLILVAAGAGLSVAAVRSSSNNIVFALAAGAALTVGVLVGAVFLVPWFTRLLGWGLSKMGATPRLAVLNALRNPRRTAATATALMLAVGLIITLQVGLSTVNRSANDALDARTHSIDLTLTYSAASYGPEAEAGPGEIAQTLIDSMTSAPGVAAAIPLKGTVLLPNEQTPQEEQEWVGWTVLAPNPDLAKVSTNPLTVADDEVALPEGSGLQGVKTIDLPTADGGKVTLKVKFTRVLSYPAIMVSEATLAKITTKPVIEALWIKLTPDADISQVMARVNRSPQVASGKVMLGGGAAERAELQQIINIMTIVLTALMGVAVLVALVGVANTLGLSILERMRESALLRAMGMQRGSLRSMLLIEALIITFAGVLIGVAAGVFFAWLGITAIFKELDLRTLHFAIDWRLTGGLLLVAGVAAALASVVPGQRAAKAAPTEALAAD